jgi:uncharacterized membrane protein
MQQAFFEGVAMIRRIWMITLPLSAVLVLAFPSAHAEVAYKIELVELPANSNAWDLNNKGEVVATVQSYVDTLPVSTPLLWRKGSYIDLTPLIGNSGDSISVEAINDRSTVTGVIHSPLPGSFTFRLPHRRIDLPPNTVPGGINNRNEVFGTWFNEDGSADPFVWRRGEITRLSGLPGDQGIALGINDRGYVVGVGGPTASLPVIWREGTVMTLPLLPGTDSGQAEAINNLGQVVGINSVGSAWPLRAFLWTEQAFHELSGPESGCFSVSPIAINDWGVIIGVALGCPSGDVVSVVWIGTQAIRLADLIATDDPLRSELQVGIPIAINDRGQILAPASGPATGMTNGFVLLSPVYQPGALHDDAP